MTSTLAPEATSTAPAPAARSEHHEAQLLRRGVAIVSMATIALVHLIDGVGKFHEVAYLGWMYMGLVGACLVVGGMLLERDDARAWYAAAGIAASSFIGYTLSRTTGLPLAKDDIGNWFEPLGIATLFAEAVLFGVSLRAITAIRRGR